MTTNPAPQEARHVDRAGGGATPWTAGPWIVVNTNPRASNPHMGWWDVEAADGRVVAASLTLADAHAVAAMPALYEALEELIRAWEARTEPDDDWPGSADVLSVMNDLYKGGFFVRSRAALAAARGEQP